MTTTKGTTETPPPRTTIADVRRLLQAARRVDKFFALPRHEREELERQAARASAGNVGYLESIIEELHDATMPFRSWRDER